MDELKGGIIPFAYSRQLSPYRISMGSRKWCSALKPGFDQYIALATKGIAVARDARIADRVTNVV
jgi:hypothetical protein